MQDDLKEYGITFVQKAKALGSRMAAGVRRNAKVFKDRLMMVSKKRSRYRLLRKAGVGTANLMRTGGVASMYHGSEVMGVSPSLLRSQRVTASAMMAPAIGSGGWSRGGDRDDFGRRRAERHGRPSAPGAYRHDGTVVHGHLGAVAAG